MSKPFSIWIGYDPREDDAYRAALHSLNRKLTRAALIRRLVLADLRERHLYSRPTEWRNGRLWDLISDAPMATQFALTRFLVPELARRAGQQTGWAMFVDCDVLFRRDPWSLFDAIADREEAVLCVQHDHRPVGTVKMDGQVQTSYPRKNWSSVMLFNLAHPSNAALTVDLVNRVRGLALHQFCWLKDDEIGAIDPIWNHLVGHGDCADPAIVHFTDGIPSFAGFENVPFADEWRAELAAAPP